MQCAVNWILSMGRLFLIDPKCKDRPLQAARQMKRPGGQPSLQSYRFVSIYLVWANRNSGTFF
jgi:hypothetical protein